MKQFLQYSIVIDIFSMLSFSLFLITGDKLTLPLGLMFLLSLFQELSFFGVSFGLVFICWLCSMMVNTNKWLLIFKGSYIVLSATTIVAILANNTSMIQETPTLVSLIIFLFIQGLFSWKWWVRIMHRPTH